MKKTIILFVLLITLTGCSTVESQNVQFLTYFDTVVSLTAYTDTTEEFTELSAYVNSELNRYDKLFDIYESYDDLNNLKTLNDMAGIEAVDLDSEIIDLLIFAKEQAENTDGNLNIAMGSVINLWKTYREEALENSDNASVPSTEELEEAMQYTDINNLIIDEENGTAYITQVGMSVDVGAIAKGYVTDKIAEGIKEQGYEAVLFNMGGNIITIGEKPDGSDWNIGVQNYDTESEDTVLLSFTVEEQAVVTSGDYQRYYDYDGVKYHHIIDPDTMYPSVFFHSVTVVTDSALIADTLSTALFSMSLEDGKIIAEEYGVKVVWVTDDEIIYSDNFN